jgi:O-antigen/teichoic acid export membrane protein
VTTSPQRRSIAAKGAQSLALRGVEVLAQALLIVVTARFLGPDGRGLYALASLTATLCVVPLGSVWSSLAVDIAKRRRPLGVLVTESLVVATAGGILVAAAGLAVSPLVRDLWWVVALPAAVTPALLWLTYAQGLYQALGHVAAFHAVVVGRVVSPLVFLSAALAFGGGVRAVLVAWAVSFVALVALVALHLLRLAGGPARVHRDLRRYRRLVGLGLRFVPSNTMLLLNTQVAVGVLAVFATTAVVGVYSVAVAGAELLKHGARAVYTGVLPSVGERDRAASAALTARAVRHSVLLAAVGSAVVVPASAVVLPHLVGGGFERVPWLLALLVPGVVAYAAFLALTAFFGVRVEDPELLTVASVLTLGSSLCCMLVLIPVLGASGAAVATSVGAVLGVAYLVRRFARVAGVPPRALVPGRAELADYAGLARAARRLPAPDGVQEGRARA